MANKYTDKSVLLEKRVWALLCYRDGSEFCFQTTLNSKILRELGITLEEGCLPRLDKQYFEHGKMVYRQFEYVGTTISLWDGETYTDELSKQLKDFM